MAKNNVGDRMEHWLPRIEEEASRRRIRVNVGTVGRLYELWDRIWDRAFEEIDG